MSRRLPSGVGTNTRGMRHRFGARGANDCAPDRIARTHPRQRHLFARSRHSHRLTSRRRTDRRVRLSARPRRSFLRPYRASWRTLRTSCAWCSTVARHRRERAGRSRRATEPAPADGVLPDHFYATTNFPTEVRIGGRWMSVALPEMDCAIVIEETGARTVALSDIVRGEQRRRRRKKACACRCRSARVRKPSSSSWPAPYPVRNRGKRCWVKWRANCWRCARAANACCSSAVRRSCIPAPAPYLAELVRDGYINAIFAGNALAVHDMESQFFGTSLGVNLHDAFPAEEGHVHHLRTVNRIRAVGGIAKAIEAACSPAA